MSDENMAVLDFSGALSGRLCRELDRTADRIRGEYVAFLEGVILEDERNLDWWVTDFVSRNTLASPFFRHCCILALVTERAERGASLREIRVDSRPLAVALRSLLKESTPGTKIVCTERLRFFASLKRAFVFAYGCLVFMKHFVHARLTKRFAPPLPDGPITLIDTFVLPESFRDGAYKDRYYGSILDFADERERERIYYLPTYYGVRDLKKLFRDLRRSSPRFLVKEDYLRVPDFLFAFLHPLRALLLKPGKTLFRGADTRAMIRREIMESALSASSTTALLNYRFFKNLRSGRVRLKRVINWFENQTVAHGLNKGVRDFHPDAEHTGYQGFPLSKNQLNLFPTEQELRCGVVPPEIAVAGAGYAESVRMFAPALRVAVAPALRYGGVWSTREDSVAGCARASFSALLTLPYFIEESARILRMTERALCGLGSGEWKVYAKLHPTMSREEVERHTGKPLSGCFESVSGAFNHWLARADLLISSTSTTTLEAVASGKPVIVIAPPEGVTHIFIPPSVPSDIWRLCYDEDDLTEALTHFSSLDEEARQRFRAIGEDVRRAFFEPVARDGARRLLGLSADDV